MMSTVVAVAMMAVMSTTMMPGEMVRQAKQAQAYTDSDRRIRPDVSDDRRTLDIDCLRDRLRGDNGRL